MKRTLILITAMLIFILSGCTYLRPTPDLVNNYEKLSFKYSEASHEDWHRHYLDQAYQYDSGRYVDSNDRFFKIYKNDELIYSTLGEGLSVDDVYSNEASVIFTLTVLDGDSIKTNINIIDSSLNVRTIYSVTDLILSCFNYNDTITFISNVRGDYSNSKLIEIDYDGNIVNEIELDLDGIIGRVLINPTSIIVLENEGSVDNAYLYNRDGEFKRKITSIPDMNIINISYINDELYILGYKEYYKNFDLKNIKIYEYKNNSCNAIFNIEIPDDYGYSLNLVEEYKDNIYLSLSVAIKDAAKSLYSRHLILKCNMKDGDINSIYKNMDLSYNAFYNNGHIYLGNFINDKYVDNVDSGEFIDIDLNQFE